MARPSLGVLAPPFCRPPGTGGRSKGAGEDIWGCGGKASRSKGGFELSAACACKGARWQTLYIRIEQQQADLYPESMIGISNPSDRHPYSLELYDLACQCPQRTRIQLSGGTEVRLVIQLWGKMGRLFVSMAGSQTVSCRTLFSLQIRGFGDGSVTGIRACWMQCRETERRRLVPGSPQSCPRRYSRAALLTRTSGAPRKSRRHSILDTRHSPTTQRMQRRAKRSQRRARSSVFFDVQQQA